MALLEVKDLKVYYRTRLGPVKAVDEVNLTIDNAEILGIVGESGCGKTTLANAIMNNVDLPCYIDGGKILFKGKDMLAFEKEDVRKMRLRQIAYIPQSSMNSLNPVMRIHDQIRDGVMAHREITKDEASKMIPELLEWVGLPAETATMYPHELSGGMKQRAVIAAAAALQPELLLADEPTTALDVVVQRVILEFLSRLKKEYGSSLIIITHNISVTAEICERIAVMYAGKIVEVASTRNLFKDPKHPYTQALIGSTPSIASKKELIGLTGTPPSLFEPPAGCRFQERCRHYNPERCKYDEPLLVGMEDNPDHLVACYLWM